MSERRKKLNQVQGGCVDCRNGAQSARLEVMALILELWEFSHEVVLPWTIMVECGEGFAREDERSKCTVGVCG